MLGQTALICGAANLLGGRPDAGQPQSLESIQLVVTAIELLLEAGDVKAADELYQKRLDKGYIFIDLPAPHWGMEVAQWFVHDEKRCCALQDQVSKRRLGFYWNSAALLAKYAGEPETALKFYQEAVDIRREDDDLMNLSVNLQNLGEVEIFLGLLIAAQGHMEESQQLAFEINDDCEIRNCLVHNAFIALLLGDVVGAEVTFIEANDIEKCLNFVGANLYGGRGICWAEHLLRYGDRQQARQLNEANLTLCLGSKWNADIGLCEWILGWLEVLDGRWHEAVEHLRAAREIFTRGHMIYELARTLVTESAMWLGRGDYQAAYDACERARELAAPRKYRLVHADALVQRARYWLSLPETNPCIVRNNTNEAWGDAQGALQLAESCNYAWVQRDASELLATACRQLGQSEESARYQTEFTQWKHRLTRPAG